VKTVVLIVIIVLVVGGWLLIHARLRRASASRDADGDER
jgi:hypothetical protein